MRLNTSRRCIAVALSVAALTGTTQALAYEPGDTIIRGGLASVVPGGSYSEVAGGAFDLRADRDIQAAISGSYMVTDNMSVDLLASTPFEHDIEAGPGGTSIGSTKHLPPTVTVSWFPMAGMDLGFKPYVGAGINYTTFWDEDLNSTGKTATGANELSLDDSVGIAAQVGVDVPLDDQWSVGASAYYADIETDAELDGDDIGTVEIDPMVYRAHVGYQF